MFEKLNTIDLNQTYEYNVKLAFDILKNDYEINQMSIPEINKKYNIVHPEVLRFFQECKFKLRNTAEGVSLYMIKNNFNASKNNYACGYHTAWTGNVFWLRSSYEEKLANKLDEIREYYEYENIRIPYIFNNEIKYYIPDFILPQRNLILETKSDYFFKIKKDKIKLQYNAGKNTGYKIDFLFQKDIKKLNEVKSFDDILSFFTNRIYF